MRGFTAGQKRNTIEEESKRSTKFKTIEDQQQLGYEMPRKPKVLEESEQFRPQTAPSVQQQLGRKKNRKVIRSNQQITREEE